MNLEVETQTFATKTNGRFVLEQDTDGWQVIDLKYNKCLVNDSKEEAQQMAKFCRAYVKKHGDINFERFPFDLDESLDMSDPLFDSYLQS